MNGFSIIEVIVVVTIISILSLLGVNNIGKFQETALIDSNVNEFTSILRNARNKSMSGEVGEGESYIDFEPDGLPRYGVEITTNGYNIFRESKKVGETDFIREILEDYALPHPLVFLSTRDVVFDRVEGTTDTFNVVLEKSTNNVGRTIEVNSEGIISITNN